MPSRSNKTASIGSLLSPRGRARFCLTALRKSPLCLGARVTAAVPRCRDSSMIVFLCSRSWWGPNAARAGGTRESWGTRERWRLCALTNGVASYRPRLPVRFGSDGVFGLL